MSHILWIYGNIKWQTRPEVIIQKMCKVFVVVCMAPQIKHMASPIIPMLTISWLSALEVGQLVWNLTGGCPTSDADNSGCLTKTQQLKEPCPEAPICKALSGAVFQWASGHRAALASGTQPSPAWSSGCDRGILVTVTSWTVFSTRQPWGLGQPSSPLSP